MSPRVPGINYRDAIRGLEKVGLRVVREGKHTIMSDGSRIVSDPRHNPIDAYTMGGILKDVGLTPEEFRALL